MQIKAHLPNLARKLGNLPPAVLAGWPHLYNEELCPMPIVANQIELQTHRDCTALRLANVEKFTDGSGYGCDLSVRSGAFAYDGRFFFDNSFVVDAIAAIKDMLAGKPGEAVLKGQWEDDAIRFRMDGLGHVVVSGLLLENGGHTQSLRFEFMTDQTVFGPLLRDLAALDGA